MTAFISHVHRIAAPASGRFPPTALVAPTWTFPALGLSRFSAMAQVAAFSAQSSVMLCAMFFRADDWASSPLVRQEISMKEAKTTPLRERMIEDTRIGRMGDKAQQVLIHAIRDFVTFLRRSPDTATSEELHAYQLQMTDAKVTPSTFNAHIVALRFATRITRAAFW